MRRGAEGVLEPRTSEHISADGSGKSEETTGGRGDKRF